MNVHSLIKQNKLNVLSIQLVIALKYEYFYSNRVNSIRANQDQDPGFSGSNSAFLGTQNLNISSFHKVLINRMG